MQDVVFTVDTIFNKAGDRVQLSEADLVKYAGQYVVDGDTGGEVVINEDGSADIGGVPHEVVSDIIEAPSETAPETESKPKRK